MEEMEPCGLPKARQASDGPRYHASKIIPVRTRSDCHGCQACIVCYVLHTCDKASMVATTNALLRDCRAPSLDAGENGSWTVQLGRRV